MNRPLTLSDIPRLPANLPEKLEIFIMQTILQLEMAKGAGASQYRALIIEYFGGWQSLRPTVRKPSMRDSTWIRKRNADHRDAFEELRVRYDLWRAQAGMVGGRIEMPEGLIPDETGPIDPSSTLLPQLLFTTPVVHHPHTPDPTHTRPPPVLSSQPQPSGGAVNTFAAQFTPQQYDGTTRSFSSTPAPSNPIASTSGSANVGALASTSTSVPAFPSQAKAEDLSSSMLVCPVERHRELWKAITALFTVLEIEHGVVPCVNCTCDWRNMDWSMGAGMGVGMDV